MSHVHATKGLCHCGCGKRTPIAKTSRGDRVAGQPVRFLRGHRIQMAGDWHANFWRCVRKTKGCWFWTGSKNQGGYGTFGVNQRNVKFKTSAHRIAYELCVGPIPDGYTVDHKKCKNHDCVNPAHLEPVPHRVNLLRGDTINARNAAKTHCLRGHKFTKKNTYLYRTKGTDWIRRQCRACARMRQRS